MILKYGIIYSLCLLLLSCSGNNNKHAPDEVSTKPENSAGTQPLGGKNKVLEIQHIEILTNDFFPLQVNAVVEIQLANGCTDIETITQVFEQPNFIITIVPKQSQKLTCQNPVTQIAQIIPLDIKGLPAGYYKIKVNGVSKEFELPIDNI